MKRLLSLCALGLALLPSLAHAEGTRDLLGKGTTDYRAFLETGYNNNAVTAGVVRKTTLYAYVQNGEKLALGQSGIGLGTAAINVYTLTGTAALASFTGTTCGLISTRAQEDLGPSLAYTGGYTACTYAPTSTALYRIEFLAPAATSNKNPTATLASAAWPTPTATDATIAAWDVSVLSSANAEQKGRVYATYFALNAGGNGITINLNVTAQTRDGYQYQVKQLIDPFGYIFFANNRGLRDGTAANTPSYQSAPVTNTNFLSPGAADTTTEYTAKLFLNPPSAALPATSPSGEWLRPTTPTLPPIPTNLSFTGRDGTAGYAGSTNGYLSGGSFSFTNPGTTPFAYRLTIPLSQTAGATDRVLYGTAAPGGNTASWDGLDGAGNPVPVSGASYTASVKLFGGEIHFPLLDVENSKGLWISRQNQAATTDVDSDAGRVYWNDNTSPPLLGNTPSNPLFTPKGVVSSSASPAHSWGDGSAAGFGNDNIIDTWAYYPSSPAISGNAVVVRQADIRVVKTTSSTGAASGRKVYYQLRAQNLSAGTPGPLTATLTDPLPAGVSAMTWTCASGCASTGGSGAVNTAVTLTGGAEVVVNVVATVSTGVANGTVITNTATVTRAQDATDPNDGTASSNNVSSVDLTTRAALSSLSLAKTVRNVTQSGAASSGTIQGKPQDVLEFVLTFTNAGDTNATKSLVRDLFAPNLLANGNATLKCPSGATSSVTPTTDATTGRPLYSVDAVTVCGQLLPGQSGSLTIPARVK